MAVGSFSVQLKKIYSANINPSLISGESAELQSPPVQLPFEKVEGHSQDGHIHLINFT